MTAFEDFVNSELPQRATMLRSGSTGYVGNPNLAVGIPKINSAPEGSWFLDKNTGNLYQKLTQANSGSWIIRSGISGSLTSSATATATTSSIDFYVSGLNGNDNNNGFSPSSPFKTITKALEETPDVLRNRVTIHIGTHSGSGYEITGSDRARLFAAPLILYGDGAGQSGEDGFTVISASTTIPVGSTKFGISGTFTPGTLIGKTIEIVSSSISENSGSRRHIIQNTGTVLTPTHAFPAALSGGLDTYRIVEPAAKIVSDNAETFQGSEASEIPHDFFRPRLAFSKLNSLVLANLNFSAYNNLSNPNTWTFRGSVVCYGCEFDGANVRKPIFNTGLLLSGIDDDTGADEKSFIPFENNICPKSGSWAGWGIVQQAVGASVLVTDRLTLGSSNFGGFYIGQAVTIEGNTEIRGGLIYSFPFGFPSSAPIRCVGGRHNIGELGSATSAGGNRIPLKIEDGIFGGNNGIVVSDNAVLRIMRANFELSTGGSTDGIRIERRGLLKVEENAISGSLGRYAVFARFGGRAELDLDNLSTQPITASSAILAVGETPDVSSSLSGIGSVLVPSTIQDGSIIQRTNLFS